MHLDYVVRWLCRVNPGSTAVSYLVDRVEQTTKKAVDMTPAERDAELARVEEELARLDAIENPPATEH